MQYSIIYEISTLSQVQDWMENKFCNEIYYQMVSETNYEINYID